LEVLCCGVLIYFCAIVSVLGGVVWLVGLFSEFLRGRLDLDILNLMLGLYYEEIYPVELKFGV